MADLCVVPGSANYGHFAAYPMVQVMMSRWGSHAVGTWAVWMFLESGFPIGDRVAVMDDFGNLVVVSHG